MCTNCTRRHVLRPACRASSTRRSPHDPASPCRHSRRPRGNRLRHFLRGHRQLRRHRRVLAARAPARGRARLASAAFRRRSAGIPALCPTSTPDARAPGRSAASSSSIGTSRAHCRGDVRCSRRCRDRGVRLRTAADLRRGDGASASAAPVWLNLEYLSAEDWVADFHLRPSPHPRYPLEQDVLFPGTRPRHRRRAERARISMPRALAFESPRRASWWRKHTGRAPPPAADSTVVSLFAYENPAVDSLLEQWRDAPSPVVLLVPEGRISGAVARFFGLPAFYGRLHRGARHPRAHTRSASPSSRATTRCCGPATSISCAAKIRSCARNGRKNRSSGTSTRKPTTPICPSSTPRSRTTRTACPTRRARSRRALLARLERRRQRRTGRISGAIAPLSKQRAAEWAAELAAVGDLAGNLGLVAEIAKTQLK